ncbi:MAG: squalene/phytoene synthase family protein [Alphaproteobacteria bacterium]|nr:MAG: squalene/phytoene synthase family protein [Alphaproteobacteria bacterium]
MPDETRSPGLRSDPAADEPSLSALVRRHDRDRYQTALFAAGDRREALLALYAFNYEIARIRETVTQSMLGQIRLQWWREMVDAAYAGTPPRQHPVVLPLSGVIREFRLTRGHFDRLIDARETDLADEPPASLAALQDYAEGSSAPLVQLALEVLGAREAMAQAAARQVGIGYALAGLLRAMGLDAADYEAGRGTPALRCAVREIADIAAAHLHAARERRAAIPRSALAAVLPAIIADRFLARLRRAQYDPFAPALVAPDPLQIWRLAFAALVGRF